MTIPMPGSNNPTECTCDMTPESQWGYHNGALDPATMYEWHDPMCPAHGEWDPEKRLTDNECADEWEAAEQGASWAVLHHALGDKRVTAWQVERFDNAARTWHRFATTPHALEATPRPPSLNDNPFEADIKEIRA